MPIERLKPGSFIDEERLAALKDQVPEAFADGTINWSVLKGALEGLLEEEGEEAEHFGLSWPGKRDARRLASRPSSGTLVPCPGEGIDEATSSNIFIEGENLEVLKLLRKSYAGRVKMIYIDPPYNTGNDFVYDDDFTEPLKDYLKRTGQLDGEGRPTTTNKKSDGRFHSKWLSMMYPRLRLARDLLRDDGVIFVSIDDNEVHHLRMLMNEVFGEENFIATVIWQKAFSPKNSARHFSEDHEFICVFARSSGIWMPTLLGRTAEMEARYANPDNDSRGPWTSGDLSARNFYGAGTYSIICPSGRVIEGPPSGMYWRFSEPRFKELDHDKRIWWGNDGNNVPRIKRFLSDVKEGRVPQTLWKYEEVGHTQEAKKELLEFSSFESSDSVFETPKPSRLIKRALQISTGAPSALPLDTSSPDIILDFFSGSGTTGHAVLNLNSEDGGNRKFILVQIPEKTGRKDYATLAEIGKERIRRVITKLKAGAAESPTKAASPAKAGELFADEGGAASDLGFKVYKLVQSNFKSWEDYHGEDIAKLDELFTQAVTPLAPTWKSVADGLFTEILLLEGYPLHSTVRDLPGFTKNRVREVSSDFHEKRLLVCLDDRLEEDTLGALVLKDNEVFICLDQAVGDELKSGLADKGLIKTI
ncbi:MAG TPA: site-specific DNA-methyltransferase [Rectinemataceae bacterium]|nr:site-specific DNA-methyltransferase [Rectinemataceae bacterium]